MPRRPESRRSALSLRHASNKRRVPFSIALAAMPHIKAGRIRPLGISSTKRSALAPDLPTVAEAGGIPGFEVPGWFGWLAPAGMPRPLVQRLNKALVTALESPDVRERLIAQSTEPVGNTPDEFGAFMKREYQKWAKVIKAANIELQ